ncbi:MAG TPA: alpha/beta hydrolase [Pyrinomonadaceae bacterium]|nr:alpha/beta hydrolase [Pyrinomonadaceae bacterium]
MPDKKLIIKGVEWEYATGGRGAQTILMFHGAVGGAETMRWLADAFGDEYRTIAPTVAGVRTLAEVCDATSAILDREHVGRAVVFGGSFGGLVAQAFLKRRRRQVEHLILLSTGAPSPALGAKNEKALKFLRFLPFPLMRALMKLELGRHLQAPAPTPEDAARVELFKERLNHYLDRELTKETFISRIALTVDFNLRERYGPQDYDDWPGRVLLIDSNDDPMIPAAERARLRETYPRALVCTFDGAGHLIPILKRDELVGLVRAFLKEDYGPPPGGEHCPLHEEEESRL